MQWIGTAVAAAALLTPSAVEARGVTLDSAVFVERTLAGPGGKRARVLEPAADLRKGDRVVFVVEWRGRRDDGFTVTNALPATIAFEKAAGNGEEVSVDGGRVWGRLGDLKSRDGRRLATPEDVTHLRWRVPERLASAGTGRITYRGIVR